MITLKGQDGAIIVNIDEKADESSLLEEIKNKFESSKLFFKGAELQIGFSGKKLNDSLYADIINTISANLNGKVKFLKERDVSFLSNALCSTCEEYTLFHKKTVRSGQFLESSGNMVIIGDVNPGAEVRAVGDIVILGAAKGIVHAGSTGNKEAFVLGLSLFPTQLRIADIITRAPDGEKIYYAEPEIASIRGQKIVIEKYRR